MTAQAVENWNIFVLLFILNILKLNILNQQQQGTSFMVASSIT